MAGLILSAAVAGAQTTVTLDLAGSWAAYERLVQAGIGSASLQELVAVKDVPPQETLPIVDIRTLLVAAVDRP